MGHMTARKPRAGTAARLRHDTTVDAIVRGSLLSRISGAALVVYMHLASLARDGAGAMTPTNGQLMPNGTHNATTIARALKRLHDEGLVRVRYSVSALGTKQRAIELVA